jgi:hypothetical protein
MSDCIDIVSNYNKWVKSLPLPVKMLLLCLLLGLVVAGLYGLLNMIHLELIWLLIGVVVIIFWIGVDLIKSSFNYVE